jgi:tryptophan-rich sensory protein
MSSTINLFIPLAAGLLSSYFSDNFKNAPKSPYQPPGWIFSVVWIFLYFIIGYSAYLIRQKSEIPKIYYLQIILNFAWPIIFINFDIKYSVIIIILLWISTFFTAMQFYDIDQFAGLLFIPYLLWISFAFFLNYTAV